MYEMKPLQKILKRAQVADSSVSYTEEYGRLYERTLS